MKYCEFLNSNNNLTKAAKSVLGDFLSDVSIKLVQFKKGDYILRFDDDVRYIWFMLSGRVATITNQEGFGSFASHDFTDPELFCEYELLIGTDKIIVDVIAKSDCDFLRINLEDYMSWLTSDTEIMLHRTRRILNVLLWQGAVTQQTIFLSATERLIRFLISYYEDEETADVYVNQNRNEIAEKLGISTRSTNRAIKKLSDEKTIRLKRGKIHLSEDEYNKLIRLIEKKGN